MNRLEKQFSVAGEAKLKYLSGEYQVIEPGEFVRCAVTGEQIPLDQLRYWSVELQEPYASSQVSWQRYQDVRQHQTEPES